MSQEHFWSTGLVARMVLALWRTKADKQNSIGATQLRTAQPNGGSHAANNLSTCGLITTPSNLAGACMPHSAPQPNSARGHHNPSLPRRISRPHCVFLKTFSSLSRGPCHFSQHKDGSLRSGHQPSRDTRDQDYGWPVFGPSRPCSVSTCVQVMAHLIFAFLVVCRLNLPKSTSCWY
jgi:hypothetical protein